MKNSAKRSNPRMPSDFFSVCLNKPDADPAAHSDGEIADHSQIYLTPESKNSSTAGSESEKEPDLQWSDASLKQLRFLVHYDLSASAIATRLPEFNAHQVVSKAKALFGDLAWTRQELVGLFCATDPQVYAQFPCRSAHDVQQKQAQCAEFLGRIEKGDWSLEDLAVVFYQLGSDLTRSGLQEELPDRDIDAIAALVRDHGLLPAELTHFETFFLRQAAVQDLTEEFVHYELPLRTPEHIAAVRAQLQASQADKFPIDVDLVKWLASVGFTRDNFRLEMPGVPVREAQFALQSKHNSYTEPEDELIRTLHQQGKSERYIASHLPIREPNSVKARIKRFTETHRRFQFKSQVDELLYYTRWYSSDSFTKGDAEGTRTTRSRRRAQVEEPVAPVEKKKKQKTLTVEEYKQLAKERQELQEKKEKEKELKSEERRQRYLERKRNPRVKVTINNKVRSMLFKKLQEEADYFQSVTGDGKRVDHNSKRKRKQTTHFIPEFNDRKLLKRAQRLMIEKPGKRNQRRTPGRRPKVEESETESSEEEEEDEEEDEEEVSPFDPYDITVDTDTPLNGRQLYIDDFYNEQPSVPELEFVDADLESDLMFEATNQVLKVDALAAKIILEHQKNYHNMPQSFPKLMITDSTGQKKLNPECQVRLRTLLYPMHSELFLLAQPKHNELNPLFEMQKFFQIHYCLFFSHSEKLKELIFNDYCQELETAVTENNFFRFLFIVDRWNMLMLHLSPSEEQPEDTDINPELRKFALHSRRITKYRGPNRNQLKLKIFYKEICEFEPPTEEPVEPKLDDKENLPPTPESNTTPIKTESSQVELEKTDSVESTGSPSPTSARPDNYRHEFFEKLKTKTSISRFCVQQILIRIYSRVVSTRSRQLRSYKAFTAEVYGELLPSFTSEVLSKVNLLPTQRFYDLGSGVGNTSFQAALEFGASFSGGCELMAHASQLTAIQENVLKKQLKLFGIKPLNMLFALSQSFVNNEEVRQQVINCDVLIVNNYLFDFSLNVEVGRLLYGLKPGTKIISLKNFITPRYKSNGDQTIFDYLEVEKHEMSDFLSVSWTANKVPYYISTVQEVICSQYL